MRQRTFMLLAASLLAFGSAAAAYEGPAYRPVVANEASLDKGMEDVSAWAARDLYAEYRSGKPYDFYKDRVTFSLDRKITHGTPRSLKVRYSHTPRFYYADKAKRKLKDERWSKFSYMKKLPVDCSGYNRLSCWVFPERCRYATIAVVLEQDYARVDEMARTGATKGKRKYFLSTRYSCHGGRWNRIVIDWYFQSDSFRKNIKSIALAINYYGAEPGQPRDYFNLYFDNFQLQRVANPRKWMGWEPDPLVITVSNVGYNTVSRKLALANADSFLSAFTVRKAKTDEKVFEGPFEPMEANLGRFLIGDFSAVTEPGLYYVQAGDLKSNVFPIAERPYTELAERTLWYMKGLRCGCKTQFHEPCHLDDFWDLKTGKTVSLVGGYHDAGDVRRYEHQALTQPVHLMSAWRMLTPDNPLRKALADETDWCLRLVERHWAVAGQVLRGNRLEGGKDSNYWTDNIPGNEDDRILWRRRGKINAYGRLFTPEILYWCAELGSALKPTDPKRSAEALAMARKIVTKYKPTGYMAVRAYVALWRATRDETYKQAAVRAGEKILERQQNRVLENSDPPFSGMIAYFRGKYTKSWPETKTPLVHVEALVDLLEAFPDHPNYDRWYFAARRYADFYVKPGRRFCEPYGFPTEIRAGRPPASLGGPPNYIGSLDGVPYFCARAGTDGLGSNNSCTSRLFSVKAYARLAGVLQDVEIEDAANAILNTFLGLNPFNHCPVAGFGQDSQQPIFSVTGWQKGAMSLYPNPYYFCRTTPVAHINEVYTLSQTGMCAGSATLNAPCRISGAIAAAGKPWKGDAVIRYPGGRTVRRFKTDAKGRYDDIRVPGGGYYEIAAGGVARKFAALAAQRYTIDLDVERDVEIVPKELNAAVWVRKGSKYSPKLVQETRRLPLDGAIHPRVFGKPAAIELAVRPLGRGASTHRLVVKAVNAKVEPARLDVRVADGKPTEVQFTVTPRNKGETVCVLVVPDGDRTRKWEFSAYVK